VYQLFINFKKAYDSVKREVLYNIPLEFVIHKKLLPYALTKYHAMKAYWGSGGIASLIF
jgi:hypothetical protein